MLTGIAEDKLPEARRGMGGSSTVDRWPFIFKDLHKLGYHTLWSEDQPSFNAFQYRLHGFKVRKRKKEWYFYKSKTFVLNNGHVNPL